MTWLGRPVAETRWMFELAALSVDPVFLGGPGLDRGDGRPVVLMPGFLAGDQTLGVLAGWLWRLGYRPRSCGFVSNTGCSERALERVDRRVEALHSRHGRRVALIGHSRGGHFARALAARRPEQVSHAISLGADLRSMLGVSSPTLVAVDAVRGALRVSGRARDPRCLTLDCPCCFTHDYASAFPADRVRMTSIYSKGDGVVRWQGCLVPYADCVEVTGSHTGLIFNRKAYRAIAAALAQPELEEALAPINEERTDVTTTPDPELGRALATDYFFIREQLTDQQLDVLRRVREFVDLEVLPVIGDYWERAELPWPLLGRLGDLGIVGEDIEGYGCPGLDPISCGLVHMELNRGDGSLGTLLGVQSGLAMKSIAMLGSEEHKQRWLPAMARLEKLGAFALTEPNHGSDSVALETSARLEGEEYVIDGAKRWIGNGSVADVIVVWARGEDGQVHGYLVEKGAPGYAAQVIEGKGSLRAVWQAEITLDAVRVPVSSLLPGAASFKDTARVLAGTRVTCAWAALGHAVAAYDTALTYSKQRHQFGRPLCSFQIVQDRLVKMLAEVTAMQLYCLQLGRLAERGALSDTIAGLAKLNNTRKARQVCAEARDMLGGNGILLENHVIRHMADIEAIHTYEGTETMQTLIVGRDITGVGAFA